MRAASIVIALVVSGCACAVEANRIANTELGYSFNLPPGFVDYPAGKKANPSIVDMYHNPETNLYLRVLRLHTVVMRRGVDRSNVKPGDDMELRTGRWKKRAIDITVTQLHAADQTTLEFSAIIPLKKEAVALQVAGDENLRPEIENTLQETLASFEGEPYVINPEQIFISEFGKSLKQQRTNILPQLIILVILGIIVYFICRSAAKRGK